MADRSAGFNIGQYHTLEDIYKHLHGLAGKQNYKCVIEYDSNMHT